MLQHKLQSVGKIIDVATDRSLCIWDANVFTLIPLRDVGEASKFLKSEAVQNI